jgi:epoxyqueuosine reductase
MKITNDNVINLANEIGFDLVGFAPADKLDMEFQNLQKWLEMNYNAGMKYMERNLDKRKEVKRVMDSAKSVISLGINYYTNNEREDIKGEGKVSRYAWGKDYHLVIWEKLDHLVEKLKKIDLNFEAKTYVDTGPVMDKAWAVKAGLGWMGKHTNIINRNYGSWFFIANVITNYEFNYSAPIKDYCGSCTACIDACPTGAIVQEYILDSSKCISYLTIENREEISEEFQGKFDNWIFGCDICQDVCPWNKKFSVLSENRDFYPQNRNEQIPLREIKDMKEKDFRERFRNSPIKRAKLKGLKRNAAFLEK